MASKPTTLRAICDLLAARGILASGIEPEQDRPITGAACDSRCVRPGNLFFCKGAAFRPAFLTSALEAGAVAYLCEPLRAEELAQAAKEAKVAQAARAIFPAPTSAPAIVTTDMRLAMALVSAEAWGRPDRALPQVGITGTKGKSTCAYMLRSIIDAAHGPKSCAIMGSIDTYDGIEDAESTNTTPEAPDLWRHLANARDSARAAMVMEVSSQALKYDRTLGVELDIAAFLNIGTDHISPVEHPSFEDYFTSKLRIFSQCKTAVVNLGSSQLPQIIAAAQTARNQDGAAPALVCVSDRGPKAVSCGDMAIAPDVWATGIVSEGAGVRFVAHGGTQLGALAASRPAAPAGSQQEGLSSPLGSPQNEPAAPAAPLPSGAATSAVPPAAPDSTQPSEPDAGTPSTTTMSAKAIPPSTCAAMASAAEAWSLPIQLNFPGLFNVENALAAIAAASLLGIAREHIAAGLASCWVPGRMELIGKPGSKVLCVVDYAHNNLSYQRFFESMSREFGGRRIVALIGAPGGKALERRSELPREAARWASHIVTTEEDPAHEANEDICREMDANVPAGATLADGSPVTHEVVLNRQQAVARCLDVALSYEEPALVCLLGKGDETLIHRGNRFEPMVPDGEAYRRAAAERGVEL